MIAILAVLAAGSLPAQDVEKVINDTRNSLQDPVTVNGSLGLSSVFYKAYGIAPRRDPFYWVLNANLNFTLFDKISVPVTAVITQQDKNFTNGLDKFSQPFNQFGLSPRYRWLTVHAGYRSLEFSEYSLSGTIWLGGGVEVNPARSGWRGAAFYGRFLKAVPKGGVQGIMVSLPSYERWGGGAKLGFVEQNTAVEMGFVRIQDHAGSIPYDTALQVSPSQNQVMFASLRQRLFSWLAIAGGLTASVFTRNLYEEPVSNISLPYASALLQIRPSTRLNKAINSSLEFSPGSCQFALRYKRIDPDYLSLGSIFLTNDVEEISANTALQLFSGKMSLSGGAGLQRNNLDQKQLLTARRVVGNVNVSYNVNDQLNLAFDYNTFSANMIAQRELFTDSIKFVQLTRNLGLTAQYALGKTIRHQFSPSLSYQEMLGEGQQPGFMKNAVFTYVLIAGQSGWTFNVCGLYNELYNEAIGTNVNLGPQTAIQRSFLRGRMRFSVNAAYQDSYLGGDLAARNYIGGASLNFIPAPSHNCRADFNLLHREAVNGSVAAFTEHRLNLAYTYTFKTSARDLRKK